MKNKSVHVMSHSALQLMGSRELNQNLSMFYSLHTSWYTDCVAVLERCVAKQSEHNIFVLSQCCIADKNPRLILCKYSKGIN